MFRYEWKKMLFYRHGLIIIALFLAAELLNVLIFTEPYDAELEAEREVYESYLAVVEGPLTDEKREYLESEMSRLNDLKLELENLKSSYYSGEVSEEEYREQSAPLIEENEAYSGFAKLYKQYIYVRADSDLRYFLYTGGWSGLFAEQEPDYLFLFVLVILVVPIFCEEYGSSMEIMLKTQKRSAKNQAIVKVMTAVSLAAGLTLITELFTLVYYAVVFGLPDASFSIQSLQLFSATEKTLTLWQAYLLEFLLKELGYIFASILILFISVLVRSYAISLTTGIISMILPPLSVSSYTGFMRIPMPWALTIGTIYLNGSVTSTDSITGEETAVFKEMMMPEMLIYVGVTIVIMVLCCLFMRHRCTNKHIKRRFMPRIGKKAVALTLALCALVPFSLLGCSTSENTDDDAGEIIYNNSQTGWYESEKYALFGVTDYSTAEIQLATKLIDLETGEILAFPNCAFRSTNSFVSYIAGGEGNTVYYGKSTSLYSENGTASYGGAGTPVIMSLNLDTMEETVYYEEREIYTWFFGLLTFPKSSSESLSYSTHVIFVVGNEIFESYDEKITVTNRITGTKRSFELDDAKGSYYSFDGELFYYIDSYSRLTTYDYKTGEKVSYDGVTASNISLTPYGIVFTNRRGDGDVCLYDTESRDVTTLLETGSKYFDDAYYDGENIWVLLSEYTDAAYSYLYKISLDDGEVSCSGTFGGYISELAVTSGDVIYAYGTDNALYVMDKDELKWSLVEQ